MPRHAIEEPLVEALRTYVANPTQHDLMRCLNVAAVQDATVRVAETVRSVAIREDDARLAQGANLLNYRRFYVGAVGIGLVMSSSARRPYTWWTFAAYNTKPSKRACKFCAEKRIMAGARAALCIRLGGLAVVGVPQPDGRSNIQSPTLHPCETCRDDMRSVAFRTLFSPETKILTAQPLSQEREPHTLSKLMRFHKEEL